MFSTQFAVHYIYHIHPCEKGEPECVIIVIKSLVQLLSVYIACNCLHDTGEKKHVSFFLIGCQYYSLDMYMGTRSFDYIYTYFTRMTKEIKK